MTHAEAQIEKLFQTLESVLGQVRKKASPKAVHHLRTTVRRLETMLDNSRIKINAKQHKALKGLFSVRKRAGRVRDLDVQLPLLRTIANRSCAADIARLRELARKKRGKRAAYLVSEVRKLERSGFSDHLSRISASVTSSSRPGEDPDGPLHEAMGQLEKMRTDFSMNSRLGRKRLHAVRIGFKRLRYLAEIAAPSDSRTQFLNEMKSIQDALGEWHDWELLARNAEKQFDSRHNSPLLAEILSLAASKREAAVLLIRGYLTMGSPRKQPRPTSPAPAVAQRA